MATSPSPQQPSTSSSSMVEVEAPLVSVVPADSEWTLDDNLNLAYAVCFSSPLVLDDGSPNEIDWDTICHALQDDVEEWMSEKKRIALNALNERYSKDNCIIQYQKLAETTLAAIESEGCKFDPADLEMIIVDKLNQEKKVELSKRLDEDKKNLSYFVEENKKYEMSQLKKSTNDELTELMISTMEDVDRLFTKEEIRNWHDDSDDDDDLLDKDVEDLVAINLNIDSYKGFSKLKCIRDTPSNKIMLMLDKLGCMRFDDSDDDNDDTENYKNAQSSPSPKKLSTSCTSSPSVVSPGSIRLQLVNPELNASDSIQSSPSKSPPLKKLKTVLETQSQETDQILSAEIETDQLLSEIETEAMVESDEMTELDESGRGDLSPEKEINRSEEVSTEEGLNNAGESESIYLTPRKFEGAEQEKEVYETPVGSISIPILAIKENSNAAEGYNEVEIESMNANVECITPTKFEGAGQGAEKEVYETPVGSPNLQIKVDSNTNENKLLLLKENTITIDDIEPVGDEIIRQEKTPVESLVEESPNISVLPLQIAEDKDKVRVPTKFFEKDMESKTNDEEKKQDVHEVKRVTRAQAKMAPVSTTTLVKYVSKIRQNEGQETSRIIHQQGIKMMPIGTGNKSDDEVNEKDNEEEEEKRKTRARASRNISSSSRTPTPTNSFTMSPSMLDQSHDHSQTFADEHQDIPARTTRSRGGISISISTSTSILEALPPSLSFVRNTLDSNPSSPSSTATAFSTCTSNAEDEREHKAFKKQCFLYLGNIAAHKNASLFLKPITDEIVEGYTKCVKRPMDLQTIRKNIENGKIRKLLDLERDLNLMFLNSLVFNSSNKLICKLTNEMLYETRKIIDGFKLSLNECEQQKEKERSTPLRRNVTISESSNKTLHDSEADISEEDKRKKSGRPRKGLKRPALLPIDSGIEPRRTRYQAKAAISKKKDGSGRLSPDILKHKD